MGRGRLSLVNASSRLRQRFEFKFPWNQTVQAPGRAPGPRGDDELRLVSSQAADTAWEGGSYSNTRSFTAKTWVTRINIQGAAEMAIRFCATSEFVRALMAAKYRPNDPNW